MEEADDTHGHETDFYDQNEGLVDLTARNCLISQGVQLPTALLRSPAAGQLRVLDLGGNGMEGKLTAADLTGLTWLRTLRMDHNRISGSLPRALSALASLRTLDLSHNSVSGVVPDLSTVRGLLTADLSNNEIADMSVRNFAIPDLQLSLQNTTACTFDELASDNTTSTSSTISTDFIKSICHPGPAHTALYVAAPVCPDATAVTCPPTLPQGGVFEMDPGPFRVSFTCRCTSPLLLELLLTAPQFSSYNNELAKKFERTIHSNLRNNLSNLAQEQVWLKWVNETFPGSMTHKAMFGFFPPVNSSDFALDKSSVDAIKASFNERRQSKYMLGMFGPYSVLAFSGPAETNSAASKEPLSTGAIVGIVLAAVVATGLVLTLVFVFIWRQRKRQYDRWTQEDYNALEGLNIQGVGRYTLKSIRDATDDFRLLIGKGAFGLVYRGDLPSGEKIAVKRATPEAQKKGVDFCNEIELLSRVRHRNCVQLKGFCHEAGEQLLVFEYVERGSLFDLLHGKQGGAGGSGGGGEACVVGAAAAVPDHALSWSMRLRLALGAARGLAYLHYGIQPPIIHRDVKSANILIDSKWRAKVADFGLSKLLPEDHPEGAELFDTTVKGTLGYLDPVYAMTSQLSDKSDVHSFGIVLLEIATGLRVVQNKRHIRDIVLDLALQEGEMSVADPGMHLTASGNGTVSNTGLSSLTRASISSSSRSSSIISSTTTITTTRGDRDSAATEPTIHSSFKRMLRLALSCSMYESDSRPDMQSVVRTLEECLQMCGDVSAAAVDGDDNDDDDHDHDHDHHHYDDTVAAAAAAASSSAAAAAAAARAAAAVAPGSSCAIPGLSPSSTSDDLAVDIGNSSRPLKEVSGSSGNGVAGSRVVHRRRGPSPMPSPGSWREESLNAGRWAGTAAEGRLELSALPSSGWTHFDSSHHALISLGSDASFASAADGKSDVIPR